MRSLWMAKAALPRAHQSTPAMLLFTGIMATRPRPTGWPHDLTRPAFFSGWGFAPSRQARRATIRCPTTTARSGRTTTRSSHAGWPAMASRAWHRADFRSGIMQAASYMDLRRLPELFCGFHRRRSRGPTLYPVACSPQAWASGAVFQLIQAILGLEYSLSARAIRLRNPAVPPSVGRSRCATCS